jgi:hypothetical protein
MKIKHILSVIGASAMAWVLCGVVTAHAVSPTCTFDRGLGVGDQGEDVRCLQQFLNDAGFVITTTGGGSPGNETTMFGELTPSRRS